MLQPTADSCSRLPKLVPSRCMLGCIEQIWNGYGKKKHVPPKAAGSVPNMLFFCRSIWHRNLGWHNTERVSSLSSKLCLCDSSLPSSSSLSTLKPSSPSPVFFSPPARWGLLDFMSVASSSCRLLPPASSSSSLSSLFVLVVLVVLVQLRPAIHSVRCRNHDHPRPVFPAGPQPRPATPSVPCRTSTTTSHAQCSLPDLNREYPRQVFPAGPHVGR